MHFCNPGSTNNTFSFSCLYASTTYLLKNMCNTDAKHNTITVENKAVQILHAVILTCPLLICIPANSSCYVKPS